MSAWSVDCEPSPRSTRGARSGRRAPTLHLVVAGEVSAAARRKAHARAVARAGGLRAVRAHVGLAAAWTMFLGATVTIVVGFLAIPNIPLP